MATEALSFAFQASTRGDEAAAAIREIADDHETMLDAAYQAIFSGNIAGFVTALAGVAVVGGAVRYGRSLGKQAKD